MNKKLYFNGNIITLDNKNNIFDCIYIENNIIKFVGNLKDFKFPNDNIEKIDLNGKTVIPAFIDSHSHITSYAQSLCYINLEDCKSFDDIKNTVKQYIIDNNINENKWLIGFNYDHENLKEKTHPNKTVLDTITTNNPIILSHVSGHMGVLNSLGLKELNITENTPNPEGGEIEVMPNSNEPTGLLLENAFIKNVSKTLSSLDNFNEFLEKAQNDYFSFGITTCQDGFTKSAEFNLLKNFANSGKLKIDIVSYIDIKENRNIYLENKETYGKDYINHYKLGGYKMFLDGSPQGKTAWMETPYLNSNEYGISTLSDKEVETFINISLEDNAQILAHCNGDAAANQYITYFEKCLKNIGKEKASTKPVMVHAQLVRKDQLKRMKKINMMPSFFNAHTFYWGDVHIKNFGFERASKISPAKTALNENILFTFHQDTPVIKPNMIHSIWCAVNRITKNGVVIGEDEKISVLEALKATTINAAIQYSEENKKGSLEINKLADFVILDKDILNIEPIKIKDIEILETIKNGETVFKKTS